MRASTCARACARARSHLASHLAVCVAQRAHLRQRVAHVPRAHAQLDLLRRLVAAVLEHRVRRARARGLVGEVESVAVEAVRGRERHVQPAVALALGALLVDAVDVLHVEAARLVALAPQHEVATCHSAAEASSGGGGAGYASVASARAAETKRSGGGETRGAAKDAAANERRRSWRRRGQRRRRRTGFTYLPGHGLSQASRCGSCVDSSAAAAPRRRQHLSWRRRRTGETRPPCVLSGKDPRCPLWG